MLDLMAVTNPPFPFSHPISQISLPLRAIVVFAQDSPVLLLYLVFTRLVLQRSFSYICIYKFQDIFRIEGAKTKNEHGDPWMRKQKAASLRVWRGNKKQRFTVVIHKPTLGQGWGISEAARLQGGCTTLNEKLERFYYWKKHVQVRRSTQLFTVTEAALMGMLETEDDRRVLTAQWSPPFSRHETSLHCGRRYVKQYEWIELIGVFGAIEFRNRVERDLIEEVFWWDAEAQTAFEPAKNGANHGQGRGNRDAREGQITSPREWADRISYSHALYIEGLLITAETPEKSYCKSYTV